MPRLAADLYEDDFYAWTKVQAKALRLLAAERRNDTIDAERLAEDVADLGKEQRNACRSQVRTIIEQLLKFQLSPNPEPRAGWERSILLAQAALDDRLTRTLERDLDANLDKLYGQAASFARQSLERHGEHEAAACIPAQCPFTLDEIKRPWSSTPTSSRPRRHLTLQPARQRVLGHVEIVVGLQIEPEPRIDTEIAPEPERRLRRHRPPPVHDLADPLRRHADGLG